MPFASHFPRAFTNDSIVRHAPVTPGIIGISSASEWILIAESENIRGSLLEHARAAGAAFDGRRPTGFVFEVCEPGERQWRCKRLVEEYRPVFHGT